MFPFQPSWQKKQIKGGHTKQNIDKHVQLINRYQPDGKWQRVELRTPKIVMTTLLQKWQWEDEEIARVGLIFLISGWGCHYRVGFTFPLWG